MKDTVITFLLLLPWLGRAAVSTMAVMAGTQRSPQTKKTLALFTEAEDADDL